MSVVIVDDQDPRIQYAGDWTKKGHFEEYMATTTVAGSDGSTAAFSFQGTSVAVYGTLSSGSGATMSFSTDQSAPVIFSTGSLSLPASSTGIHHQPLFTSDALTSGNHTLIITQVSGGQQIFLDYILYNATSTANNTVFVDDNEPQLDYSEGWVMGPNSEEFFQNTSHICGTTECSLNLDFEGRSLTIYGDFLGNATSPLASFNVSVALDGGSPTPLRISDSTSKPQPTSNFEMYSSPLSPGKHRAVLTTHESDQFLLDYVLIGGDGPSASADSSGANTAPDSSPTVSSALASPTLSAGPSGASKFPVAAVVGIAVGGFVFFMLLLLGLLLWRRRLRRQDSMSQESFTAIAPPLRERPQSTLSVATLLGDGAAPGEPMSEKDVEEQKGRPVSRYLYYNN